MRKKILSVLFVLVVGCKGVPLTSLPELFRADPLRDDPNTYSIAFEHTRDVATRVGSESFSIKVSDLQTNEVIIEGRYRGIQKELQPQESVRGLTYSTDKRVLIYTLNKRDTQNLKRMQSYLAGLKLAGKKRKSRGQPPTTRVDWSVKFQPCKTVPVIQKDAKANVYVKIRKSGPFVPLYQNIKLHPYLHAQHKGVLLNC